MELAQEAVDGAGTGSEMQILASRIKGHVYSPVEHGRYGRVHMKLRELGKVLSSIDGEIERTAGMLDDGVGHLSEHLALCADRRFRQKGRHFCQKAKPEASRVCRCESEPLGEHDSCHDSEMHEGELWIAPACKDAEVTLFLLKDRISETDKIKAGKLISNNYVPNTSHTKGPYRCTSNSPESIQVNLNIRIGMEDDGSPTKRTGKCPSTASAFVRPVTVANNTEEKMAHKITQTIDLGFKREPIQQTKTSSDTGAQQRQYKSPTYPLILFCALLLALLFFVYSSVFTQAWVLQNCGAVKGNAYYKSYHFTTSSGKKPV